MSRRDMVPTPREWVARTSRIDRRTEIDRGGRFLEWAEPDLAAADMQAFFARLRRASERADLPYAVRAGAGCPLKLAVWRMTWLRIWPGC
jgi:hypothetical protein